jgi:hypothetical protein
MKRGLRNRKKCVTILGKRVAGQKQNEESRKGDEDTDSVQTASEGRFTLFVFVTMTGTAIGGGRTSTVAVSDTQGLSLRDSLQ